MENSIKILNIGLGIDGENGTAIDFINDNSNTNNATGCTCSCGNGGLSIGKLIKEFFL